MRDSEFECTDENDEEISATKYVLQRILVTNNKGNQSLSTRDRAVSSVTEIFHKIECLQIPSPGPGLSKKNKQNNYFNPDFYQNIDSAKQHAISNTPLKQGFNGLTDLDGPMLAALLDQYVQALNKPDTVPNLEVSYQKAVEITLTETILDLAEKYRKQMTELLDLILPLEEGDIEALKQAHLVLLKKSLKGTLKEYKNPIETVKKTDTLFVVHEKVYTNLLKFFMIELDRRIPESPDANEILQKDKQTGKRQLLEKFEQLIITTDQSFVLGGFISIFTQLNKEKSENSCKEAFEKVYKQQTQIGGPEREVLKDKYYKQALGPVKDKVFQDLISQIPEPPQKVIVHLETQTLSWEKSLVNADAVNYYYVEWYREGGDTTREKVHTNHFKLQNLKPKTYYFIKVQGFDDHKNRLGEYSTELKFQTRAGKPEKPKMPKISPQTEEKAKVTVTMLSEVEQNGSPVTNIIIGRSSDKISTWVSQNFPVESSQGEFQKLVVDHVNCNNNEETLYFRVQFENEAGVSESSDGAQLEIADMIPGKPENIRTTTCARQIQVTWDPPINNSGAVNSYQIQHWEKRNDQGLFLSESDKTVSHDQRYLGLTSLRPYTEYTIRVYARNENNKKANGYGTVDVRTLADVPDKPHPPTIRVTSAKEAMITFYRQQPNEENGSPINKINIEQQIKRAKQVVTKWTVVKKHSLEESSQTDIKNVNLSVELINLTEPLISCYRVVTVNSIGGSEPSQPIEVHPESIIPGLPQKLISNTTSNSITISWKKPEINPLAAKQYRIQYKEEVKGTWTCKIANTDTFSCSVSELRPNTKYNFTVQTISGTLMSEEATLNVCTPPSVPPKPRQPIVIPRGREFILKAYLPLLKESGRETTELHVNYYNYDRDSKVTMDYKIEHKTSVEDNTHEQQIQVNIDETCWISISLSNEIGRSQESDLVGISHGNVTPGQPDKLECTVEARNVKLSWNVPKQNGNAAKYYEVLIKDTEDQEWKTLENISIHQKRCNRTLSYEAKVKDLIPFTTYQFGVQGVNNTTINICEGDIAELETKTEKAPPDKPVQPNVKPIMGEPLLAELELKMLTNKQMNGSPVDCVIIECEYNKETKRSKETLTAEQQVENTNIMLPIELPNLEDPKVKTYSFLVQMKNGKGDSPPSDVFVLPVSELQPGPPKNIDISEITAHTLQVKWEEPDIHPALVTHYDIEYIAIQASQHSERKSISVKSDIKECTISKLRSNQQYCVKVIAVATNNSEPIQINVHTCEIYPSAPKKFFVDKISSNSVKVRWRKPKKEPEEVYFYTVKLRLGNYVKALKNTAKATAKAIPKVIQVRRTLGHSTVFDNLNSFTKYTVSVGSYNDNKKRQAKVKHKVFKTKMSASAKLTTQVLSSITLVGPGAIAYAQRTDEHIYQSDDEFKEDLGVYPSVPEDLEWEWHGKNEIKVAWKLPIQNSEEVHHFEVQVSEQGSPSALHTIESYEMSETFTLADITKNYEVSVTSFNFYREKRPVATRTLVIGADYLHTQALEEGEL